MHTGERNTIRSILMPGASEVVAYLVILALALLAYVATGVTASQFPSVNRLQAIISKHGTNAQFTTIFFRRLTNELEKTTALTRGDLATLSEQAEAEMEGR